MMVKRTYTCIASAIVVAFIGLVSHNPIFCQEVSLTLTPSEVELPPLAEIQTLVLLDNKLKNALDHLRLSWIANTSIGVIVTDPTIRQLDAGSQHTWLLRIARKNPESRTLFLHVRLDYRVGNQNDRVIIKTLTLKPYQMQPLSALAELQERTSLVSLNEKRPGEIYLIVTNKSTSPLDITAIKVRGPSYIQCQIPSGERTLSPGESQTLAISVSADRQVQSGKHLLLFQVTCRWNDAGVMRTGSLYETREVQVGVLGESEILTALGVPSFLILPGFLLIVTVNLLWMIGKSKEKADLFVLKATTSAFWLVAITYSIIAAILYPALGMSRNYIDGYGIEDVVQVWMWSVGLGAVGYLTYAGGRELYHRLTTKWREEHTPSGIDTPVMILQKLSRSKLRVGVEQVCVKDSNGEINAYLLEPRTENASSFWIGPSILLKFGEIQNELMTQIQDQLDLEGDAGTLADLIERGAHMGVLTVRWDTSGRLDGPKPIAGTEIVKFLPKDIIVRLE